MHEPLQRASESIGCKPVSTDRFVRDALEWLERRTDVVCLSNAGEAHTVSGDEWSGTGDTLPMALVAAIKSYQAARLMSVNREKA